ncbi:MAG: hypothetical protein M0D55_14120 [Elusimicrobiota bacterium]|nr:MAG: hypothetical protein M0D55_14120 [Elusimicrobiota bacterium]
MLKITGRRDSPQASVEIDASIPFILRLGGNPGPGESLIWSCREGNFSLFELWLDANTGAIHRVALVLLNIRGRIAESDQVDHGPMAPTPGRVPVCDISGWSAVKVGDNYNPLEFQHRFDLHLGKNFASVRFHDAGEPREWIVNHRSRFGINSNDQLCRIDLIGLKPDEFRIMRKALNYEEKPG